MIKYQLVAKIRQEGRTALPSGFGLKDGAVLVHDHEPGWIASGPLSKKGVVFTSVFDYLAGVQKIELDLGRMPLAAVKIEIDKT